MDEAARIVAGAAGAVAVLSLLLTAVLAVRLRRLRAAQRAVLGGESSDLVDHVASLSRAFEELSSQVSSTAQRLDRRMAGAEDRLDHAVSHTSVVRYDAYNEMSGHQSSSVALLDAHRTGVVLSAILHRDQARLYAKPLIEGRSELDLSPEEERAIAEADASRPAAREPDGGR